MNRFSDNDGLRKLIFSDQLPESVEAGMHLLEDPDKLVKKAAPIFNLSDEALRPPEGYVGIHTIALGDWETYGMNRNGDTFPKKACVDRHQTFVTHGHVFRNHDNRDPAGAIGKIAAAAYNEPMGRIELVIWADENKAQPELHKLATEGDHPFSMACKVPFDRCTVCGNLRKSGADPNQCEHVRDSLGYITKEGVAIGTHNDIPTWFDESFVNRPADRIAWSLGKVASLDGEHRINSVKLAEINNIWVPDELEFDVPGYKSKLSVLTKLANLEEKFLGLSSSTRLDNHWDRYMLELSKAASASISDSDLEALRTYNPENVFKTLAKEGIVLDASSFFKYAMGLDYGALKEDMPAILNRVRDSIFTQLYKSGSYQRVCRNSYFDIDIVDLASYGWGNNNELAHLGRTKLAEATSFTGPGVDRRIIEATIQGYKPSEVITLNKLAVESPGAVKAAEIYAAYKVSTINSILSYHKQANSDRLLALAAVQDLVR